MIAKRALEGLPLEDIFIFDVHAHLDNSANQRLIAGDGDGLVDTLDKLNIAGTCVSSNVCLESSPQVGNDLVLEATRKHPSRIYGYVTPTPYYKDFPLEKYFDHNPGMVGIKIHAMCQKTAIRDEGYRYALEYADKHALPVLYHAWTAGEVADVAWWASQYKNCPMIIGHGGLTDIGAKRQSIDAIRKYDNVYLDTCISCTYDGAIEWIVGQVGADRVLFGTDLGVFDCRQNYGKLALSKLSDADKIKIFGENARKLFRL